MGELGQTGRIERDGLYWCPVASGAGPSFGVGLTSPFIQALASSEDLLAPIVTLILAVANKIARIAWAVLARHDVYRPSAAAAAV